MAAAAGTDYSPSVTVSNEEQALINKLMALLQVTEQWIERTYPTAQPGSAFAGDDAKIHPYEVSHQASQSMGVAVDHLHSMRMALTGTGDNVLRIHTYAPLSLTRVALENAALALWLSSPAQRPERILRRLRLEMANLKAVKSFFGRPNPQQDAEIQRRKDRVNELAFQAGVVTNAVLAANPTASEEDIKAATRTALTNKPTATEIVQDAGQIAQLIDGDNNLALMLWRVCSAVAHGDRWVLTAFDIEVIGPSTPGVSDVRITAPTDLLVAGVQVALAMYGAAYRVYDQRVTSHR
ncbi:hypothetical protein Pa4123_59580 [Phytohabitans aurantiacus]|uniref:DUF222 domain-containing protein n=1 Tax=Phytohabitans aurantiacus TaxID=3016789 RepID=A0ABQ5R3B2_9ACTN|nr:hypothetical protein Pa4123_59580 [Phytohabitans aurantiacus]